jgi:hypothetical protein
VSQPAPEDIPWVTHGESGLLTAYILKNDVPDLRQATVALAMKYGRMPVARVDGKMAPRPGTDRWVTASGFLRELDAFQGMTLNEVKAILGEPTNNYGDSVEWCCTSRMHVNPTVRIEFKDGKARSSKGS